MTFYPLIFSPAFHARVWGGRNLEKFLEKKLPAQSIIGESWEIYDTNIIINGEYSGHTLKELLSQFPREIGGTLYDGGDFPLLVKFLDAQDWLSVQVHPNDELAQSLEGQPRGKTECWYVVEAEPDAAIIYGFSERITAQDFRDAIDNGNVKELLHFVNVKKGDFIFVPAGTIHALGKGVIIYELQQTSDTTYRLYDWDRLGLDGAPRELHIDKGLICTDFSLIRPSLHLETTSFRHKDYTEEQLTDNPYFSLQRITDFTGIKEYSFDGTAAQIITILEGIITISGNFDDVIVHKGMTVLLPACLQHCQIIANDKSELLIAHYNS
ncbi:MAG: class I mannose-6-phosphate isomerase [Candidatus Kapabacteria bacterium]|nr:class I mannose-6-phosphate isomerase [Candidatus Kapabacteria bacterium]